MLAILLPVLSAIIYSTSGELYSSIATLKALIGAEKDIPGMITAYVNKEMDRLDYLKRFYLRLFSMKYVVR